MSPSTIIMTYLYILPARLFQATPFLFLSICLTFFLIYFNSLMIYLQLYLLLLSMWFPAKLCISCMLFFTLLINVSVLILVGASLGERLSVFIHLACMMPVC